MTWHEDISLEVAVEFARLQVQTWDRIEDRMWTIRQYTDANWSDHGQWWRRTTAGRRYFREYARARTEVMKKVIVAVRGCVACGKPFEVNAARKERGRDRVCSRQCRGAARRNIERVTIDGVTKTLSAWSESQGIALGTVWMRRKRGWDLKRALGMNS